MMRWPFIRLIRQARNSGVISALNRGLAEAGGEMICFTAADDTVGPEYLAHSVAALLDFPAAAFCFSDPAEFLPETATVAEHPLFLSDEPRYFSPAELVNLFRRNYFTISSNAVVYRRALLANLGQFEQGLLWATDWFVNLVLGFQHGACYVPERLTYFRVSPQSYSARGVRQVEQQRHVTLETLQLLAKPRYAVVAPAFRDAAILPVMSLRALTWVAGSPLRGIVTPRLIVRMLLRSAWSCFRPRTPLFLRRAARWLLARQVV
jgi:hypothetical protein